MTEQAGLGFGGLLRQLRTDAGLTQDELAEAAQVSQRAVSDLERGINRTARKDTAVLLAGALGLDEPARDLFVAAARGQVPAAEVLAATSGADVPDSGGRLPAPVASFVGREAELAELSGLAGQYRLITITGTGGVGKTRLAIEIAAARLGEHRDGVWFVDLAELTDPAGVAGAVADAMGLRQVTGQPIDQLLAERVAAMQALLVVDNCEHLIDSAAATVERVLEAGPGVQVLATSRQPLRVPGERVWQTPPIAFPPAHDHYDPAELASFDAVRLFLDRAPDLADASAEELRVIAQITARLEGLPLAIELAAARAAQLGLRQLAEVLEDRMALSWLGSRTGHARQQTLAAIVGWSYDLLAPPLQHALKRLSVFAGGFTLEAAGAMTGDAGAVAEMVAALAERSLITADRTADPGQPARAEIRYRMLETIRQYCAARAAADDGPEAEKAARDAHSRYFAGLARQASAALTGWQQGRWLTTLEADHANLIAAINHLLTQPSRVQEALQMTVHLDRFWRNRGHIPECAALLRRGLTAGSQTVSAGVRCGALNLAGNTMAWSAAFRHDLQAARLYLIESLQLARATHDDFHAAGALWALTYVSYIAGDPEGGSATGKGAVELARTVGDPVLLGECLLNSGLVGDSRARRAIYEEALDVTRRSGDRINTASSHNDLGLLALAEDDLEAARHHFEQARAILREVGHPSPAPVGNLGWVHLRQSNLDLGNSAFLETLLGFESLHDRRNASYAILGLACSAAAEHEWEQTARLLGFADGELEDCGGSWSEPERTYRQQAFANTQRHLGTGFDRCYDSGRAGERSDIIDRALRRPHAP